MCIEHNHLYRIRTSADAPEQIARTAGSLKHAAQKQSELPGVGDWVVIRNGRDDPVVIQAVLPRRAYFSRKAAGSVAAEQVVAANIDTVFIVCGLDGDFNLRRIQRYLVAAADSGADSAVVLNKADLSTSTNRSLDEVRGLDLNVPVHVTSCVTGQGLDAVAAYLCNGHTVALLGSSGVGKSAIINRLIGAELQRTRAVRARDSMGRHTTVHRELLVHPNGGIVIDTPGMRELRLWKRDNALEVTFDDIKQLAENCRFRDCDHRTEPDCAVQEAVTTGQLSADRLTCYRKLQEEQAVLDERRKERI